MDKLTNTQQRIIDLMKDGFIIQIRPRFNQRVVIYKKGQIEVMNKSTLDSLVSKGLIYCYSGTPGYHGEYKLVE